MGNVLESSSVKKVQCFMVGRLRAPTVLHKATSAYAEQYHKKNTQGARMQGAGTEGRHSSGVDYLPL